jgi:hypothetical protein
MGTRDFYLYLFALFLSDGWLAEKLRAFVIDISIYLSIRNFEIGGVNSVAVPGYLNGVPRRIRTSNLLKIRDWGITHFKPSMLHKPRLPT